MDKDMNTLETFVKHQRTAVEEAGKALISLIPNGFREHGWNAVKQSAKGFQIVIETAADAVKDGLERTSPSQRDMEIRIESVEE